VHGDHRDLAPAHQPFGNAAEQGARDPGPGVGADHDRVAAALAGDVLDRAFAFTLDDAHVGSDATRGRTRQSLLTDRPPLCEKPVDHRLGVDRHALDRDHRLGRVDDVAERQRGAAGGEIEGEVDAVAGRGCFVDRHRDVRKRGTHTAIDARS